MHFLIVKIIMHIYLCATSSEKAGITYKDHKVLISISVPLELYSREEGNNNKAGSIKKRKKTSVTKRNW